MLIELLSIVIFTFALGLCGLGAITWWIERNHKRRLGSGMLASGLLIAAGYAFLGSRFSLLFFDKLIITVDLPRLMATAVVYTLGVLSGLGLAGGLFLWISGQLIKPTPTEKRLVGYLAAILVVALAISLLAVQLSR